MYTSFVLRSAFLLCALLALCLSALVVADTAISADQNSINASKTVKYLTRVTTQKPHVVVIENEQQFDKMVVATSDKTSNVAIALLLTASAQNIDQCPLCSIIRQHFNRVSEQYFVQYRLNASAVSGSASGSGSEDAGSANENRKSRLSEKQKRSKASSQTSEASDDWSAKKLFFAVVEYSPATQPLVAKLRASQLPALYLISDGGKLMDTCDLVHAPVVECIAESKIIALPIDAVSDPEYEAFLSMIKAAEEQQQQQKQRTKSSDSQSQEDATSEAQTTGERLQRLVTRWVTSINSVHISVAMLVGTIGWMVYSTVSSASTPARGWFRVSLAGAFLVYFVTMGGTVFNRIHGPPPFYRSHNGWLFIYPNHSRQFALEGYAAAFIMMCGAGTLIAMTTMVQSYQKRCRELAETAANQPQDAAQSASDSESDSESSESEATTSTSNNKRHNPKAMTKRAAEKRLLEKRDEIVTQISLYFWICGLSFALVVVFYLVKNGGYLSGTVFSPWFHLLNKLVLGR